MNSPSFRYTLQFLGSVVILALPIAHIWKLGLFLVFWGATFGPLTRREGVAALAMSAFFSGVDLIATWHRVYFYWNPDVLTMASYGFVFYGFFTLHLMRRLKGPLPNTHGQQKLFLLAGLFGLPFLFTARQDILLGSTAGILIIALLFHHQHEDVLYTIYAIIFGCVWESIGVSQRQWGYPSGSLPLWLGSMWGGIGFFTRRLLYPKVYGNDLSSDL